MSVKRIWSAQAVLLILLLSGCSGLGTKRGSDGSPLAPEDGSTHRRDRDARDRHDSRGSERSIRRNRERHGEQHCDVVGEFDRRRQRYCRHDRRERNVHGTSDSADAEHDHGDGNQPDDATQKGSSTVTLQNPIPVLNSVSPSSIPAGAFSLTLTRQRLREKFHCDIRRTDADHNICFADGIASRLERRRQHKSAP